MTFISSPVAPVQSSLVDESPGAELGTTEFFLEDPSLDEESSEKVPPHIYCSPNVLRLGFKIYFGVAAPEFLGVIFDPSLPLKS